ncbi:MAG TPA: acetolactate synthase small subunit [Firmicutes bacterium]|nr:acetolactate synthase small subunit [Bacillota bacterium]
MKHTISVLVANHPGVLARVAGLFSRRGFNIDSLAVGETEDPAYSRMTIVVQADERQLEQVTKQLHKLIDVLKVSDLTREDAVSRELVLLKVFVADAAKRTEILQIVDIFRAKVVDVAENSLMVEITGDEGKVEGLIQLLRPYGIREMMRTGKIVLTRAVKGKGNGR